MVVTDPIMKPGIATRYPLLAFELGARRRGLAERVEAPVQRGLPKLVQRRGRIS